MMNERRWAGATLALATVVGVLARAQLFAFETTDYRRAFKPWQEKLVAYGGFSGVAHFAEFTDYPASFISILGVLAEFGAPPLAGMKTVSCGFDVLLAAGAFACVRAVGGGLLRASLGFAAVFLTPTVVLNSSMWCQCDAVYAAFLVWSLYFLLRERFAWAVLCCGGALAFKLQAVFVVVPFLALVLSRRLKLTTALLLPVPMVLFSLPAVLAGARWADVFGVYGRQAGSFERYSINAPNLYALVPQLPWLESVRTAGVIFAMVAVVAVAVWASRQALSSARLVWLFFVSSLMVPFLLPTMHDRYFYVAEVSGVLLAVVAPRAWWLPVLVLTASLNAYVVYLFHAPLFDMRLGALMMFAALAGALWAGRRLPPAAPAQG